MPPAETINFNIFITPPSATIYIVDHPDNVTLKDNGGNVIQEEDVTYNSSSGTPATKLTLITSGYYATNGYGNYNTYGLAD